MPNPIERARLHARFRSRRHRDCHASAPRHFARGPIDVRLATAALRLVTNAEGEVAVVVSGDAGGQRRSKSRRGVVLACGGFEADHAMQRQYWNLSPVLPVASRGNTGDGIRMAGGRRRPVAYVAFSRLIRFPSF